MVKLSETVFWQLLSKIKCSFYLMHHYWYFIKRDLKYSSTFNSSRVKDLESLLIESHVIEKGITMPNRKFGFGIPRVRQLITRCKDCLQKYDGESTEIQATIADLKQYRDIHAQANFVLPEDVEKDIILLERQLLVKDENCYWENISNYFNKTDDFIQFSHQRRTLRWFSNEDINMNLLKKAIENANTAPSACNRQATRVKIISDKKIIKTISSEYQNGNRGFGDSANKWLLITSEQGAWSHTQMTSAYIDAGIFTMNLLYSLHYYGIAACTLNAHLSIKQKKELQELLKYPESEIPILFIAIGKPTEKFMVAKSRRTNIDDILTIV